MFIGLGIKCRCRVQVILLANDWRVNNTWGLKQNGSKAKCNDGVTTRVIVEKLNQFAFDVNV